MNDLTSSLSNIQGEIIRCLRRRMEDFISRSNLPSVGGILIYVFILTFCPLHFGGCGHVPCWASLPNLSLWLIFWTENNLPGRKLSHTWYTHKKRWRIPRLWDTNRAYVGGVTTYDWITSKDAVPNQRWRSRTSAQILQPMSIPSRQNTAGDLVTMWVKKVVIFCY